MSIKQAAVVMLGAATVLAGAAVQAAPMVQAVASSAAFSPYFPNNQTVTAPTGSVSATNGASTATTTRRSVDLSVLGDGIWSPDGLSAFGQAESNYTVRDLDTGLQVDPGVMAGQRLTFHFGVSGNFTIGHRTGTLPEDILTNSQLDVWLYGGPVFQRFYTDYSAVCSAPHFGGCSLDNDGDYLLMNDSQVPATTLVAFGFDLAQTGQVAGTLWMGFNAAASTGDVAQYRLDLAGVSFDAVLSPQWQPAGLAAPRLGVFLDDGTQLPLFSQPVPEPASVALLVVGLACLAARRGEKLLRWVAGGLGRAAP